MNPLDLERLAVRIEGLLQVRTFDWAPGDELEFKRALPPRGLATMEARPWQLPAPSSLRDVALKIKQGIPDGEGYVLSAVRETYRNALQVSMRLEGLVRDNDPRNPKRMMWDMARGKFPGRYAELSPERVASRFLKRD